MKHLKTIFSLVILATLIISCNQDNDIAVQQDKLTKEKLIKHLKERNPNYIFKEPQNHVTASKKEALHFKSLEELDAFLDTFDKRKKAMLTNAKHDFVHVGPEDGSGTNEDYSGYYRTSFYIGGFIPVYMNINFNTKNCEGSNLNSYISGGTMGVTYMHSGGNLYSNKKLGYISYYVEGVLNYNIFIEGIGTIYSENVSYGGKASCK
ncbi:conserved protein of unknown function [Tenacibaculum sp. 190130A14a]|uniref:Lipoprotein n=1 Tax=Tenacibaculum polynesiense TaxID=3137857 RepID=A0ABM9PDG8_9FLAO